MPRTPFLQLTMRGQIVRMRALARLALPRFGLRASADLVLLGHGENTVFGVPGARGMRYALRIHRTDYQSPAAIRSELAWLAALRRDTPLPVQRPRAGCDGDDVQQVSHPGVPGERSCSLLGWVPGPRVGTRRGLDHQRRMGRLCGILHEHGRRWKRPRSFERMRWDEHTMLRVPAWGDPLAAPGLRRRDRDLFARTRDEAAGALQAFPKTPTRFGLIHADLHGWNVVRQGDAVVPIDFDDCGFGWFLHDILIGAIFPSWGRPEYERMVAAFVEAYIEERTFDVRDLAFMDHFAVARYLNTVGWLASRQDNPDLRALLPRAIKRTRAACRTYAKRI